MRIANVRLAGCCLLAVVATAGAAPKPDVAASPEAVEFFEKKVRPILLDSCVGCHGEKKQKSGLRLDSRAAILEGGENGPALVPGDPDKSLLVQVVRYTHEDIKMPPKEKLSEPALAALTSWVRDGAPWPTGTVLSGASRDKAAGTHWSFQPVRDVVPPTVKEPARVATPVDAFILSKLDAAGIPQAKAADRRTVIRRATFDLIGLPPTPEEIAAFEADRDPNAFAKVVDRLLASPRYGERWGRHWLDVARYADTKGYVFTEERRYPYSFTYRDYVIRSFNEDLPYDQFIMQQIAADRLPQTEDNRALAALGYLTVGRRFLNDGNEIIDDRIDVVSRGMLGLTVVCARCHDHKYDPIPTEDYYSLYGVFASSVEPAELPVIGGTDHSDESRDFEKQRAVIQKEYDDLLAQKFAEVQTEVRSKIGVYLKAAADLDFNRGSPKVRERAFADVVPQGRLTWVIDRWMRERERSLETKDPIFLPWRELSRLPAADFAAKAPAVLTRLSTSQPPMNPVVLKALAEPPVTSLREVGARYATLFQKAETLTQALPKKGAPQKLAEADWDSLRQVLYSAEGPISLSGEASTGAGRTASELARRLVGKQNGKKLNDVQGKIAKLTATHPGGPLRAMVMNDAAQPMNPQVFVRGNPGRRGKQVPRQFLQVLSGPNRQPFPTGSGRLELAQAIADPKNPLTARVLVNRVWLQHFGVGLVSTPSDFGLRSDPPSHPELLDFLAKDFVKSGWSIKTLHRRIMLSNTYQQSSDNSLAYLDRDPEDRLLWKYPRRRLDFEALRDGVLAVSGALDTTMGGRSIPINDPPFPPRRTVYGFIDRQNLDGIYRTFDFASPDATSARRFVTTVPQQALFLMNSPFIVEQTNRIVAGLSESSDPRAGVIALYQRIVGRSPDARELLLGMQFIESQEHAGASAELPSIWQYGFGRFDESTHRVVGFERFPFWSGQAWQFGPTLPHPQMAFLHLTAGGGHVGADSSHAAIRRFVAPEDAEINIEGTLDHSNKQGNGVQARVIASRGGELGAWKVHDKKVRTHIGPYRVAKGESIDFIVDSMGDQSFDSFGWSPTIRTVGRQRVHWKADADFAGPAPALSPWAQLAQVLLLTNEFVFID